MPLIWGEMGRGIFLLEGLDRANHVESAQQFSFHAQARGAGRGWVCERFSPILRTPARQASGNLFRASRIVLLHPAFNPASADGARDAAPNQMHETGEETHHQRI